MERLVLAFFVLLGLEVERLVLTFFLDFDFEDDGLEVVLAFFFLGLELERFLTGLATLLLILVLLRTMVVL